MPSPPDTGESEKSLCFAQWSRSGHRVPGAANQEDSHMPDNDVLVSEGHNSGPIDHSAL